MELNKNILEDTATTKLQDIQRQREELDRMETQLIKEMVQDDLANKALIRQLLEDSVCEIFNVQMEVARQDDEEEQEEREDGDGNEGEETRDEDDGEKNVKEE